MPLNQLIDSSQPIIPPPDVQRTSLSIDVLSRFVCDTWDEATAGGARSFEMPDRTAKPLKRRNPDCAAFPLPPNCPLQKGASARAAVPSSRFPSASRAL
jgi:hypothetical protein